MEEAGLRILKFGFLEGLQQLDLTLRDLVYDWWEFLRMPWIISFQVWLGKAPHKAVLIWFGLAA